MKIRSKDSTDFYRKHGFLFTFVIIKKDAKYCDEIIEIM